MRDIERRVVLATMDRKWREHLYEMDYTKDGIGLRGMGRRTLWSSISVKATRCMFYS